MDASMTKYRFMKEVNINGTEFYFTEKRFMFFFWIYVQGSVSRDVNLAFERFEKILKGEKSAAFRIM